MRKIAIVTAIGLATTTSVVAQSAPVLMLTQASPIGRSCPDPSARQIDFQIIQRISQFRGRVRILGAVRNVGRAAYESNPGQQTAYLYENSRLVAERRFQNLAPGQEVRVAFERNWNASSPAEGEFPPIYKLAIGYDPDISSDGNPKNDDCNLSNNKVERSSGPINTLFR